MEFFLNNRYYKAAPNNCDLATVKQHTISQAIINEDVNRGSDKKEISG